MAHLRGTNGVSILIKWKAEEKSEWKAHKKFSSGDEIICNANPQFVPQVDSFSNIFEQIYNLNNCYNLQLKSQ